MDARRRITGQVPMLLRRSFVQQGGESGRTAAPRDGAARQIPAGLLFRGGTRKKPPLMLSGGQTVKEPRRVCACGRKESPIIFFGDMCGEENTSQAASVEFVRRGAQIMRAADCNPPCQKVILFDSLKNRRPGRGGGFLVFSLRAAAAHGAQRAAASAAAARARCLCPRRWPAAAAACRTRTPANSTRR